LEGKLDASRLTPTQKLIQKSFDRHYQKGYEANAAEKRELQRQAQELAQAKAVLQSQTAPPKTWEEAFTRDRSGTLQQVDQAIEQKFRDFENAEAYQLMRLRESLIANETQKVASAQQMNHYIESMSNRANVEVLKDIPDFQNKVLALDKFAIEDGIDQRVLQMITNAPVLDALLKGANITDIDGVQAVKQLVKFVNKQYERKTAAQSAETKKNIPSPKPLISAGTRSGSSSESKDLGRLNYPEYKKARAGA
jgi:hypothetical protein